MHFAYPVADLDHLAWAEGTAFPVAGIKDVAFALDAKTGRVVADGAGRVQGDAHFAVGVQRGVATHEEWIRADVADSGAADLAAVLDIRLLARIGQVIVMPHRLAVVIGKAQDDLRGFAGRMARGAGAGGADQGQQWPGQQAQATAQQAGWNLFSLGHGAPWRMAAAASRRRRR